jgi:hypothetical protein
MCNWGDKWVIRHKDLGYFTHSYRAAENYINEIAKAALFSSQFVCERIIEDALVDEDSIRSDFTILNPAEVMIARLMES